MNNPEYICDVCSAPSDDVVTLTHSAENGPYCGGKIKVKR